MTVATRLRGCVRPHDTVARLGGDEFAVLLPHTREDDAVTSALRITAALGEPVHLDGAEVSARASVGLAAGTSEDPDALLRGADTAMYATKRGGKGGFARHAGSTPVPRQERWPQPS